MAGENNLIQCYNRGCGLKYDPETNTKDLCRHHPGAPFFHDAYKGWSCCQKKCTDFTEFLNIQGCTLSRHSNEKPPEPEKSALAPEFTDPQQVIEVKPLVPSRLERPPFEAPVKKMQPIIAASVKSSLETVEKPKAVTEDSSGAVPVGTICKNGGCNRSYEGPDTDLTPCVHHPGCPIFHEGLKFWSCCQKRTSDFNAFLNQEGCEKGTHVWMKDTDNGEEVKCRWDWHQTGSHVVVSVYAKLYCPERSFVELNPIRLHLNLTFPQQVNGIFDLDFELRGIVNVEASQVSFFGTKVEVKLKKAEAGSWANLNVPRETAKKPKIEEKSEKVEALTPKVDAVDLSDL